MFEYLFIFCMIYLFLSRKKRKHKSRGLDEELKGLDIDEIIDSSLGDAEDEDDDAEVEEAELEEEDLRAMSLADLKELANDSGIKFKPDIKKDELVQLILDFADEEEH